LKTELELELSSIIKPYVNSSLKFEKFEKNIKIGEIDCLFVSELISYKIIFNSFEIQNSNSRVKY
jgi:hypothetical protein